MNNIKFLEYINAKIVKHIDTNEYFVYVGAIYGYDEEHNYDYGMLFKINSDLVDDVYSIEEIVKTKESNEYIHEATLSEIANGLFNTYIPVNDVNIQLYKIKNDLNNYHFTEYELNTFCITFMNIIKQWANFENDNMNTNKNQIYKRVIDFYSKFANDETLANLKLVLQSTAYTYIDNSTQSVCGCNSASTSTTGMTGETTDCVTLYENAMYMYLVQMLSDIDFYYDFFHENKEPIHELIDNLILLIEEFKSLEYDLSFTISRSHCNCSQLSIDNGQCNYNILDNYITLLNWIKNCEIEENTNKIKIYGKAFAELLPKLLFYV